MSRFKAVIFDLDDTLCAYSIKPFEALRRSLETGRPDLVRALDADRFGHVLDRTWAEGQARAQAGERNPFPYGAAVEAVRRWLLESGVADQTALRQLQTGFLEVLLSHLHLVPGAREVVHAVKVHHRVGLLTNGPSDLQWGKIRRLGIEGWFDGIVVSDDIGIRKPDARIFQALLARLQVLAQQAVYVGDSAEYDVLGAHNAGLASVWLNAHPHEARDGPHPAPDVEINRLEALLAWLK